MKSKFSSEFIYKIFALLIAVIVVHAVYVGMIRPSADAIFERQLQMQAEGKEFVPSRSLYVILKDYEQETCFILMLWAMAIIGHKAREMMLERALFDQQLIRVSAGMSILPEDARDYLRPIQALKPPQSDYLLARVLKVSLQRFASTRNIQSVSTAIRETCEIEADRLDSELSMIRYIAWAIPSIGFIGTVRGIGAALGQAHEAVQGNIAGVTASLGVAFNSTFIALVISIIIMFLVYQLQLTQERLVLDSQRYCDDHLMHHLQVRGPEG